MLDRLYMHLIEISQYVKGGPNISGFGFHYAPDRVYDG